MSPNNQRNTAIPRELPPQGVPENDMEQLCFGYNARMGGVSTQASWSGARMGFAFAVSSIASVLIHTIAALSTAATNARRPQMKMRDAHSQELGALRRLLRSSCMGLDLWPVSPVWLLHLCRLLQRRRL